MAKTLCPITREQFLVHAKDVEVTIAGVPLLATVKQFSTDSLGWYLSGKTVVKVDGVPVSVQIGLNLTIVGSKELPQVATKATPPASPAVTPPATKAAA